MSWYAVKTWYRATAKGRPRRVDRYYDPDLTLLEERVVLIKAKDFRQAIAKAQREAKEYSALSYETAYGQTFALTYLGACEAYECYEEPGDGTEIYSRMEQVSRKVNNRELLRNKLGGKVCCEQLKKNKKFFAKELALVIQ